MDDFEYIIGQDIPKSIGTWNELKKKGKVKFQEGFQTWKHIRYFLEMKYELQKICGNNYQYSYLSGYEWYPELTKRNKLNQSWLEYRMPIHPEAIVKGGAKIVIVRLPAPKFYIPYDPFRMNQTIYFNKKSGKLIETIHKNDTINDTINSRIEFTDNMTDDEKIQLIQNNIQNNVREEVNRNKQLKINDKDVLAVKRPLFHAADAPILREENENWIKNHSGCYLRLKSMKYVYPLLEEYEKYNLSIQNHAMNVPVPEYYICHRCNQPGHFINNCPMKFDSTIIKRQNTTGIPKSMLRLAETDEEKRTAMIDNDGNLVVYKRPPQTNKFLKEFSDVNQSMQSMQIEYNNEYNHE